MRAMLLKSIAWGLALGLVTMTACAGPADRTATEPDVAVPTPADPDDPAIARRPYTPQQIADKMPVGFWTQYLVEQFGKPAVLNKSTVVAADAESITLSNQLSTEVGDPVGEPVEQTDTWLALQHHATFPLDATSISETEIDLPSGRWDCWLYTVRSLGADGSEQINHFHFAKDKPGAPVRYEMLVNGKRVYLMSLVGLGD